MSELEPSKTVNKISQRVYVQNRFDELHELHEQQCKSVAGLQEQNTSLKQEVTELSKKYEHFKKNYQEEVTASMESVTSLRTKVNNLLLMKDDERLNTTPLLKELHSISDIREELKKLEERFTRADASMQDLKKTLDEELYTIEE